MPVRKIDRGKISGSLVFPMDPKNYTRGNRLVGELKSLLTIGVEGINSLFWLETIIDRNGQETGLCDETLIFQECRDFDTRRKITGSCGFEDDSLSR